MPHIIIDSTKKDIAWKWDENSILNHISKNDSPKDIFDAVCDEISRYYSDKDSFKTFKKKLRWTGRFLNCEMTFTSSHSNTAGDYVVFEIVSTGYSNDISGMEKKGMLYLGIRPKNFDIHDIDNEKFNEIIGYIDACVEFFKSIDSYKGFEKLVSEQIFVFSDEIAQENRRIFLEKIKMEFKEGWGWKACYDEKRNLYTAQRSGPGYCDLYQITKEIYDKLYDGMEVIDSSHLITEGRHLYMDVDDRCGPPYTVVLDEDYKELCPWAKVSESGHVWPAELTDAAVQIFESEKDNREQRRKKREEREKKKANGDQN